MDLWTPRTAGCKVEAAQPGEGTELPLAAALLCIFCNFSNDVYQIIQFGFHTKHFLCETAKGPRTQSGRSGCSMGHGVK